MAQKKPPQTPLHVAILRCENLPSFITWEIPEDTEIFEDDKLLIAGLESNGFHVSHTIWSDPEIDWNKFDIAIIRSTWDYIDRREEFLNVLSIIEASSCKLFNPLKAVKWNSDKLYLFDLEKWNVPVVPTFQADNSDLKSLKKSFAEKNWNEIILKPTVGAAGFNIHRIKLSEVSAKVEELISKEPKQVFLIQPLIDSVITEGEWSYVYINGKFCQALLKKPADGDFRSHLIYGGSVESVKPTVEDLRKADEIFSKLPFDLLYARLDLVRINGMLAVMELELIEPILYFDLSPKGIEQMINAVKERLKEPAVNIKNKNA